MASILESFLLLILLSVCPLISGSQPQSQSKPRAPFKPNALILTVSKDSGTNLHVATIQKRTPLSAVQLVVDLNGQFLWVNCDQHYLSSTYNAPVCHSTQCSRAGIHYCHKCPTPARTGCHNNACGVIATNPLTRRTTMGELAQDVLSIQSSQGSMVTVPQFLFACAPSSLIQGPLTKNVQGFAGLGHNSVALPGQLASHFGFSPRFSLCLTSSSNKGKGVILFGNWPYKLPVSSFRYTPLTVSPQGEYYIQVTSIKINDKPVSFNNTLFSTNKQTMISTTTPYTVLDHSIFGVFTQIFSSQLTGVTRVSPVSPFQVCFNSKNSRVGPAVPNVDFFFQNGDVTWRIAGANSMVQAKPNVWCLGFVDGGSKTKAPIVIGSYQLEDNLLQFDLAKSRLGFSSSLVSQRTSCANFNFTSTP